MQLLGERVSTMLSLFKKIQRNFTILTSKLTLNEFIHNLYERGLLTYYDYESLISKSRINQNRELIFNLEMYGETVIAEFIQWLQTNNHDLHTKVMETQQHNSGYVQREEERVEHKKQIMKNYVLLNRCVNVNVIAPRLYQHQLLSPEQFLEMMQEPNRFKQARIFLTQFVKDRPDFFQCVLEALKDYQPDLYTALTA